MQWFLLFLWALPISAVKPLLGHRLAPGTIIDQDACNGGMCCGFSHYPVTGAKHYTEFDVPGLPANVGPTYFVYYNIDWQPAGPPDSDAKMNQFVPQLMLGNPLCDSSGPPLYKPIWHEQKTWVFGAQYFFEIFNQTSNRTEAHAATGKTYPCVKGEILFTEYVLDKNWIWTLRMGVKGDPNRVSTVTVEKPFMGLLPESQTKSWSESVYSNAVGNSCWELYGIKTADQYPTSGSTYDMRVTANKPDAFSWSTNWHAGTPTCPGHPNSTVNEKHTNVQQDVTWKIFYA